MSHLGKHLETCRIGRRLFKKTLEDPQQQVYFEMNIPHATTVSRCAELDPDSDSINYLGML